MPQIFNLQRLIFASVAFAIMVMASSTACAGAIEVALDEQSGVNKASVIKEHVVGTLVSGVSGGNYDGIGPGGG